MHFTRPLSVMVVLLAVGSTVFAIGGGDITFKPAGTDPVMFSHDHHAKTRGLKCAACHFQRFAQGQGYAMNKETLTKRDFCSHCHNGMKSFDAAAAKNCTRCHKK
ncbi:MAG: c(7)-type cytochrome triheme domain-containing protein [Nitrospirota bacterium]